MAAMKLWPPFSFARETRSLAEPSIDDLLTFGITPTASGVAVSPEAALRVPAVAAAVSTIAGAIASLKIGIVELAPDGTATAAPAHRMNELLRGAANDWTSGFELIRSLIVDALCFDAGGLAWVNRVNGEVREVINPASGVITCDRDSVTLVPSYRWQGRPIAAKDIIHVHGPFPRAPLSLAREAIGVAAIMESHAARLFGSGAKPSGILTSPKPVGDEASRKIASAFRSAFTGVENAGKVPILWDGMQFTPTVLSSVDNQFQELRLFQLQEIARAFNIPAPMIGDLTRATWSNTEQMQRQFLMLTLEPWIRALESAFDRSLFSGEERGRFAVRFERDDFSNVDLSARATAVSSLISSRTISPNEARAWLDLPPRIGGNTFENPNTGASQPGGPIGAAAPQEPKP